MKKDEGEREGEKGRKRGRDNSLHIIAALHSIQFFFSTEQMLPSGTLMVRQLLI